jgi:hypothetical protein
MQWMAKEAAFTRFNEDRSCAGALPDLGGDRCASWHERGSSAKRLGLVSFVTGGVLATAAAGLLLWHLTTPPAGDAALASGCVPAPGALSCRWTF